MAAGYRRTVLHGIAQAKLDDAELLLGHGRASNAYYLAGYAVEIGLKACIAKQIYSETIPDKQFIEKIYTHKFLSLVTLAGLKSALAEAEKDVQFATNWALINEWTPETRYESVDIYSAQIFLQAITDPTAGVFQWLKMHW